MKEKTNMNKRIKHDKINMDKLKTNKQTHIVKSVSFFSSFGSPDSKGDQFSNVILQDKIISFLDKRCLTFEPSVGKKENRKINEQT